VEKDTGKKLGIFILIFLKPKSDLNRFIDSTLLIQICNLCDCNSWL